MTNAIASYQGMIFITILSIVYALIIRWLKPFRLHKKRKQSTVLLKFSYIIYLGFYFIYIYKFLFSQSSRLTSEHLSDIRAKYYLIIFILLTLLPNLAIILRRQIHQYRANYNIIFAIVNGIFILWIIFLLTSSRWGILI